MIRQLAQNDFIAVKRIKDTVGLEPSDLTDPNYRIRMQEKGFLLKIPYTQEKFAEDLKKTCLVYEDSGKVIGFLRIETVQEISKETNTTWFQSELRDLYFSFPHTNIGGIAVLPEANKKGIATALLYEVVIELKKRSVLYLFSSVVISPVTNIPSIMFHEKHGFERIALSPEPPEPFGINHLWSLLYAKKLLSGDT